MEFTSNAILKGPIWAETLDALKGKFFDTYWDVFALCISIGMMYDGQIESDDMVPEGYEGEPCSVPHGVLEHAEHRALLEFMVQAALITTKHLDLGEAERLTLAFDEKENPDFSPVAFLTKFANFGVTKLHENLSDEDETETMLLLATFLNNTYKEGSNLTDSVDSKELEIEE